MSNRRRQSAARALRALTPGQFFYATRYSARTWRIAIISSRRASFFSIGTSTGASILTLPKLSKIPYRQRSCRVPANAPDPMRDTEKAAGKGRIRLGFFGQINNFKGVDVLLSRRKSSSRAYSPVR